MRGQLTMIVGGGFIPHRILVLSHYEWDSYLVLSHYECNKYLRYLTKSVTKSTKSTRHLLHYTKVLVNILILPKKCLTLLLLYAIMVIGGA